MRRGAGRQPPVHRRAIIIDFFSLGTGARKTKTMEAAATATVLPTLSAGGRQIVRRWVGNEAVAGTAAIGPAGPGTRISLCPAGYNVFKRIALSPAHRGNTVCAGGVRAHTNCCFVPRLFHT